MRTSINKVAVGLLASMVAAGALYAAALQCWITLRTPCATGGSVFNPCPDPYQSQYYEYRTGNGQNVNQATKSGNGAWNSAGEPAVGCIQSFDYDACPNQPADSGSITNSFFPSHASGPLDCPDYPD